MKHLAQITVLDRTNARPRGVALDVLLQRDTRQAQFEDGRYTPYWLRLKLEGTTALAREGFRIQTPDFDLEVLALASNVPFSEIKLFLDGHSLADDDVPLWALSAPHNLNRRLYRMDAPLLLPAQLPVLAEMFYDNVAGVPAGQTVPEIILHCRRLDDSQREVQP